jgi:polar amino acid transport system substrate-binding protein
MKTRPRAIAVLAAATSIVLAACSSSGAATPNPQASAAAPAASAAAPAASAAAPAASAAAPASGSAAQVTFNLVTPGIFTVATDVTYPPWMTIVPGVNGAADSAGGVDGALLNAFAAEYGLKLQLLETDFPSMLLDAQQGKADIASAISYNPKRAQQLYFTAPFGSEPVVVYTLSSFDYTSPDSLKGKRLGTGNGYFEQPVLEAWQPGTVLFPNGVAGNTALLNGQIDAWFSDASALNVDPFKSQSGKVTAHSLKTGDFGFTEEQILGLEYNGVKCGNGALAQALDKTLKRLHDSGQWATIISGILSGKELTDAGIAPPAQGCPP